LRRVEERFACVNGEGVKSLLQNLSSLNDLLPFVKCFFEAYPLAAEQLLAAEDIFVRNQLKVDSVDFQRDDSQGNPVLAYLQHHGTPQGLTTPLANGFVQKDCAFAGHSLEYSALTSIADVLHISALVDVVFCQGITMQRAVGRDSESHSNYAMCAVINGCFFKSYMVVY
jgi:hypothetical protein